jgi:hypothetical protein
MTWKRELRWSTDPGRLIDALGLRDANGTDTVAAGVGELMATLYEPRSV